MGVKRSKSGGGNGQLTPYASIVLPALPLYACPNLPPLPLLLLHFTSPPPKITPNYPPLLRQINPSPPKGCKNFEGNRLKIPPITPSSYICFVVKVGPGMFLWRQDTLHNSILPNALLPNAIMPHLQFYQIPFDPMPAFPACYFANVFLPNANFILPYCEICQNQSLA